MDPSDTVKLILNEKNTVVVHKFGATVVSWVHQGKEVLFVSSQVIYNNKKAIRGGIPVVFPNFGPWDLGPQHGFARISTWNVLSEPREVDGAIEAVFQLTDNESTRAMWNYKFDLRYTVSLTATNFTTSLIVINTGENQFDFTTLLHTYLKVNDIYKTTVSELKGLTYTDKLKGGQKFTEENDLVGTIGGADSVYENTGVSHRLVDQSTGLTINIEKSNLSDTVLWNPWIENAAKMADFGDDEYKIMICVEPGAVSSRLFLAAGEKKEFSQTITVVQ